MDSWIIKVVVAILALSPLIIIHEGGHYLAARAFGMRVLRYSIGFGPTLAKWKPKGSDTTFQIGLIPFLAYVQIAGMNPEEDVDPNDPALYPNKSLFARAVTIAAGPFANYLTASLIVFGLGMANSLPQAEAVEPMTIKDVTDGSPAAKAGLQPDDVIVGANGQTIKNFNELVTVTSARGGQPTLYIVERAGKRLEPISVTPTDEDGNGRIGVAAKMRPMHRDLDVAELAKLSMLLPYQITTAQISGLGKMARQRSLKGTVGPLGMGAIVADAAQAGLIPLLWILMFISVALGFFNLLPFPALDGGRLIFLGYEAVTRQRANERFEMLVHTFGIVFLLGVILLVTFRDIERLWG